MLGVVVFALRLLEVVPALNLLFLGFNVTNLVGCFSATLKVGGILAS